MSACCTILECDFGGKCCIIAVFLEGKSYFLWDGKQTFKIMCPIYFSTAKGLISSCYCETFVSPSMHRPFGGLVKAYTQ